MWSHTCLEGLTLLFHDTVLLNSPRLDLSLQVQESLQFPFKKQMRLEVVDKTHLCRTRVALVEQVVTLTSSSSAASD